MTETGAQRPYEVKRADTHGVLHARLAVGRRDIRHRFPKLEQGPTKAKAAVLVLTNPVNSEGVPRIPHLCLSVYPESHAFVSLYKYDFVVVT